MENIENEQKPTSREKWEVRQQKKLEERTSQSQTRLMKKIGFFTAVVIGVAGLGFLVTIALRAIPPAGQTASLADIVTTSDWQKGNPNAPVTIVEYSDFQCPACAYYYPIIKETLEKTGESVRFVYRHFPLTSVHPKAEPAALAAEAAGMQGKFWEMHDLLFENQKAWSEQRNAKEFFMNYAATLGLDVDAFEEDLDARASKQKIESHVAGAFASGVQGTPTFFINGTPIQNPQSVEEFEILIAAALTE
ncbi:MAG: DsbA family protein [Patescibacteria group bacterium]